ncbi:MAG: hypothetical protein IPM00_16290 [Tetrasphaera sp.]|nr:hypothetical protein [Tetrasphaera sp.]
MPLGRVLLRAALLVALLAVVGGLMGFVGVATGASSLGVGRAVLGRTVLTLVGLATVTHLLVRGVRAPLWIWAASAAVALALNPLVWTAGASAGGALFGIWLTGSAWAGLPIDLLVWTGVVTVVAHLASRSSVDEDDWDRSLR